VAVRESARKRAMLMARRCGRRVVAGLAGSTTGRSGPSERPRADGRQTPLKAFSNILSWRDGPSARSGVLGKVDRRRFAILSWGSRFAGQPAPPRAATFRGTYHAPFRRCKRPSDLGRSAASGAGRPRQPRSRVISSSRRGTGRWSRSWRGG
jgi:hypothetical protein